MEEDIWRTWWRTWRRTFGAHVKGIRRTMRRTLWGILEGTRRRTARRMIGGNNVQKQCGGKLDDGQREWRIYQLAMCRTRSSGGVKAGTWEIHGREEMGTGC
jgi:hypothetical protein